MFLCVRQVSRELRFGHINKWLLLGHIDWRRHHPFIPRHISERDYQFAAAKRTLVKSLVSFHKHKLSLDAESKDKSHAEGHVFGVD